MHEIDRGVGFQDIAPHPLAGVRLARHQQNLEPVAHAVDDDRGAVVGQGQLVRPRLDCEFKHVRAAVVDRDRQLYVLADRHQQWVLGAAVLAPDDPRLLLGRIAGRGRQILDADRQRRILADEAEARRLGDHEPPVALARMPRQQHLQRRAQLPGGSGRIAGRHVVHLAVGDHHHPGEPLPRDIGHRPVQAR